MNEPDDTEVRHEPGHPPSGPSADRALPGEVYRFRSRKSWALLAYLILTTAARRAARLAELLFPEADDPVRALRWSLSEIRRGLGPGRGRRR